MVFLLENAILYVRENKKLSKNISVKSRNSVLGSYKWAHKLEKNVTVPIRLYYS